MKKFFDGGEYFALTSYRIKAVPISDDNEVSLTLAKTICEDASSSVWFYCRRSVL